MRWLLDLFCGEGGAAMGYHRAGFEVIGVDSRPQPRYPFRFIQAEALTFLGEVTPKTFDAIHASPPCQFASAAQPIQGRDHPNLIPQTRELLRATGLPYVIENVERAQPWLDSPIKLCGSSFGLDVQRHRLFEANFPVMALPCAHHWQAPRFPVRYEGRTEFGKPRLRRLSRVLSVFGHEVPADEARRAMEMPWATRDGCNQAIPPAYAEHIGEYLLLEVNGRPALDPYPDSGLY